jgi:hypothetical protein
MITIPSHQKLSRAERNQSLAAHRIGQQLQALVRTTRETDLVCEVLMRTER